MRATATHRDTSHLRIQFHTQITENLT